jgi:hypothetical protein
MQGEIDWHKVHSARIAACCTRAATDNHVPVEAPFTLSDPELGTFEYIALFPTIGSGRGIVVCLASDWEKADAIAHKHGYGCAGLEPEQYSSYNPSSWVSAFGAWGKAGG